MHHEPLNTSHQREVADLFTSVFAASEGNNEGKLIGKLVDGLSSRIDQQEIIAFGTIDNDAIIGAIFFSPLRFSQPLKTFMLSPVAVATSHQRAGIGQSLINHGLDQLKARSVSVVITYGDPAYYGKFGFQPLSENVIQAPHKLSMPQGWLGQSLSNAPIPALQEQPRCVEEFNDPRYW